MVCVLYYKLEGPHHLHLNNDLVYSIRLIHQKLLIKNCAVGNEPSSFVCETSNMSRLGLISEHKKSNLFQIELMFSCPIIGQFEFFSFILVRTFKFLLSGWSTLLFIEVGTSELNTKGCSDLINILFIYDTWTSFTT